MPTLRPFNGIRYSSGPGLADLVCPPYDIITAETQADLGRRHHNNAVHLELPPDSPEGPVAYAQGAATFRRWMEEGVLRADEGACLYVYRQDFLGPQGERRRVAGVLGALGLEPWGRGSGILPHERTMPGPVADRLSLLRACPVNISPIYAIYRGAGGLAPYFDALENRPPAANFVDDEGTRQRLWVIDAPAEIDMLSAATSNGPLIVADGHHRYETALAYHEEQEGAPGGHDAIMCLCVDIDGEDVLVLPYHRAISAPVTSIVLKRRLIDTWGAVPLLDGDVPATLQATRAKHSFLFVLPEDNLLVEVATGSTDAVLDIVVLHDDILPSAFVEGIDGLRFLRDTRELVEAVRVEGWDAGVLLKPVQAAQVAATALTGERMPQKATYFWPKAPTGLVFRSLG
ncbi:MAG: DUF1015 domain-containing protein [Actinomycetota bacterium]|nr:DUF1015 domain-containing protein [Actinomycetota bacterium]